MCLLVALTGDAVRSFEEAREQRQYIINVQLWQTPVPLPLLERKCFMGAPQVLSTVHQDVIWIPIFEFAADHRLYYCSSNIHALGVNSLVMKHIE